MAGRQPFLGPVPGTVKVYSTNFFFYPNVLTSHLRQTCYGSDVVKYHLRTIDEAAMAEHKSRITVPYRHVDNAVLKSTAIGKIPAVSMTTGKIDCNSVHTLFPLDIIAALKKLLLINHSGHYQLARSFSAIEEYFVDQLVNVCALSQGSGNWCSFVSLRRDDWDVNNHIDWEALCNEANKGFNLDDQREISASGSVEAGADVEGDARFAQIVQSLLLQFGNVAFAAFFRLQDQKYHYYRVTLPLQRQRQLLNLNIDVAVI